MPEPLDPRAALTEAEAAIYSDERRLGYQRAAAVALVAIAEHQQCIADALEKRADPAPHPERIYAVAVAILTVALGCMLLIGALIN